MGCSNGSMEVFKRREQQGQAYERLRVMANEKSKYWIPVPGIDIACGVKQDYQDKICSIVQSNACESSGQNKQKNLVQTQNVNNETLSINQSQCPLCGNPTNKQARQFENQSDDAIQFAQIQDNKDFKREISTDNLAEVFQQLQHENIQSNASNQVPKNLQNLLIEQFGEQTQLANRAAKPQYEVDNKVSSLSLLNQIWKSKPSQSFDSISYQERQGTLSQHKLNGNKINIQRSNNGNYQLSVHERNQSDQHENQFQSHLVESHLNVFEDSNEEKEGLQQNQRCYNRGYNQNNQSWQDQDRSRSSSPSTSVILLRNQQPDLVCGSEVTSARRPVSSYASPQKARQKKRDGIVPKPPDRPTITTLLRLRDKYNAQDRLDTCWRKMQKEGNKIDAATCQTGSYSPPLCRRQNHLQRQRKKRSTQY